MACRMCAIQRSTAVWDCVLWESAHFVVVPSKGGFLPGWLLIVPREHVLSMGQIDPHLAGELDDLTTRVIERVRLQFGPPTCFEHGAVHQGTTFGCGIDHAHVHVVPLPRELSLRATAEAALGSRFEHRAPKPGCPYLRIREPGHLDWVTLEPEASPPRQFFRQLIWRSSGGAASSYDYDAAPCDEEVERTVAVLRRR